MGTSVDITGNCATTKILFKMSPAFDQVNKKFKTLLFYPQNNQRKGEGGLRRSGYFKHSYKRSNGVWYIENPDGSSGEMVDLPANYTVYDELPLITVVTVVFNDEKHIEKTIQSVINQTYPNIEYIVIDGGSTDKTLDIIKKYEDCLDYWISEKDEGIYDAMNKGIDLASGKWINFMNSGDEFYNNDVVKTVFCNSQLDNYDVVYGNLNFHYVKYKNVVFSELKPGKIHKLWQGMKLFHQSSFVKTYRHKAFKFNVSNLAADFEVFYNMYLSGLKFHYVPIVMSRFLGSGVSERKRYQSLLDCFRVVYFSEKSTYKKVKIVCHYFFLFLFRAIKDILKILLPEPILSKLISIKNRYRLYW